MNTAGLIILFVLSLTASFLFSGMESGVLALNRVRIRQLDKRGNRRAQLLHGYLKQPEQFLWTILVGNTLANFVGVSMIVLFLKKQWAEQPWVFWPGFLGTVFFLLYGLCDLLPKMMFRLFPTRLCLLMAVPFRFINSLLAPIVGPVTWLAQGLVKWSGDRMFKGNLFGNREELRMFVQESSQNLSSEERLMINRVLDLQHRTVRQIAIPLASALTVTDQTPMREVMTLCREHNVTRLPVWQGEGTQRRMAGILSLRSALYREDFNPELKAAAYLHPSLYLEEDTPLEVAFSRLQRAGERVAIVLDRHRKEIGIVSLQDILKAVFGEVQL